MVTKILMRTAPVLHITSTLSTIISSLSTSTCAGRIDAQRPDATGRLPAEDFSADQLKQAFQQQGLSVQEFLALAGAHTVRAPSLLSSCVHVKPGCLLLVLPSCLMACTLAHVHYHNAWRHVSFAA